MRAKGRNAPNVYSRILNSNQGNSDEIQPLVKELISHLEQLDSSIKLAICLKVPLIKRFEPVYLDGRDNAVIDELIARIDFFKVI